MKGEWTVSRDTKKEMTAEADKIFRSEREVM